MPLTSVADRSVCVVRAQELLYGETTPTGRSSDGSVGTLDDSQFGSEEEDEEGLLEHQRCSVSAVNGADSIVGVPGHSLARVQPPPAVGSQTPADVQAMIERGLQETARARVALEKFAKRHTPLRDAAQPQLLPGALAPSLAASKAQRAQQDTPTTPTQQSRAQISRLLAEALAERRAADDRILSLQNALISDGPTALQPRN